MIYRFCLLFWCVWTFCTPAVFAQTPTSESEETISERPSDEKNPWAAAGFSLIIPGTGQMYVEERAWPEVLITAGMALAVAAWVVVEQQRSGSVRERLINGQSQLAADAHWDALTLICQIAVPALWLWNAGDAYKRAEMFQENVTGDLENQTNTYIIEENLVSVTLWQF